jgi:hypothetical protein
MVAHDVAGETNADAMKSVLERSCFGFLDHSVTKIARGLPSVLFTGGQVQRAVSDTGILRFMRGGRRLE